MVRNAALIAEAKRLHRQVTKKVSRIKQTTGALVSGTSVDPRKAPAQRQTMNARALRSYIGSLEKFLSRKEQFVAGSRGTPIHRNKWQEYKRAEAAANQNVSNLYNKVKDKKLPNGMTVDESNAMRAAIHPQMTNPSVNTPRPLDRQPKSIERESALDKLTADVKERQSEKWFRSKVSAGRDQWRQMVDLIDTVRQEPEQPPTQRDRVDALSDDQFAALLFYTNFMEDASLNYEYMMKLFGKQERAYIRGMAEAKMEEYDELIGWAEDLTF